MPHLAFTFLGKDDAPTASASAASTVKSALGSTHVHHYKLISNPNDEAFTTRDTRPDPHNAYNSWETAGPRNPAWAASWGVQEDQLPALVATEQSTGRTPGYLSVGAQTTDEEIKAFAADPWKQR